MELVLVNGQGLTETYGWTLEEGNYPQLLRAPKLKPSYTYSWPNADGEDYDPTAVPAKECQDFTLSFLIMAASTEELLSKYENFINLLLDPVGTDWQFLEINKAFRLHFVDAVDWTDVDIYSGSARVSVTLRNRFVVPKTTPNAPTAMVFDAGNRTIDFTFNPEYTDLYDYEYTLDGGATWSVLTVKPIELSAAAYPAYSIGVRIAETVDDNASPTLWHSSAIAGDFMAAFIGALSVGGYTYDDDLLREKYGELPLSMDEGLSLFPYAYKNGAVALMNNADGSVVDAAFTRAGAGWAMQDGDIAELSAGVPRWDEFYYDKEVGYLVEESATNKARVPISSTSGGISATIPNSDLGIGMQLYETTAIAPPTIRVGTSVVGWQYSESELGTLKRISLFVYFDNSSSENSQCQIRCNNNINGNIVVSKFEGIFNIVSKHAGFFDEKIIQINSNIFWIEFYTTSGGTSENSLFHCGVEILSSSDSGVVVGTIGATFTSYVKSKSNIFDNSAVVTRPAESLQIPLSATSDIWLKYADHEGNIIEQVIEDVPSGNFNVHDQITNGKLLALIAPMRKFTGAERSVLND